MMCSGANLAYTKQFFIDSGGYEKDEFVSGDDMMLMLKAKQLKKDKLHFITKKMPIVRANAAATFLKPYSSEAGGFRNFQHTEPDLRA